MTRIFLAIWLLVPVGVAAWHFGPGQPQLSRDKAGDFLKKAEAADANQDWTEAAVLYGQAAAELPEGNRAERERLQVLQARARIRDGEILEGQEQLDKLLTLLRDEPAESKTLAIDAYHELATASYYAAWTMRLEGATADEWKPEAEVARQIFRGLAENTTAAGDDDETFQRNLENTIRLEQMDLATLRAKPPPKKCNGNCNCNCKNLSQRKRKQCQSRCQNPGKQKKEDKELRKIIHSAGVGTSEGSGS